MASVKLLKFLGEAPRITTELLPDGAAQRAFNAKLYSGDLIPYKRPTTPFSSQGINNINRGQEIKTLYGLTLATDQEASNGGTLTAGFTYFLSWTTSVDVVKAAEGNELDDQAEQRFYYTGDGPPKVSTFKLITNNFGFGPFPPADGGYYQLGLPLPETKPTTVVTPFTALSTVSFARDSANQATVVTSAPHNVKTGNIISITGFTGTTPETFNSTNVTATVLNETSLQYFNVGDPVSTTANTNGSVALAGTTQSRNYIYSWITPWGEESIPSEPSDADFIKEGQVITLDNLPSTPPTEPEYNFIRGVRLYRTLPTATGTAYYRLTDAWWPVSVAKVSRTTNISTVEFADYHNLSKGDRFKISGCTDTSFNITDGIVKSVVDNRTITFDNPGVTKTTTADTTGKKYHDVSETLDDTARYFGDPILTNPYHFVDDFLFSNLTDILGSLDNDAPPETMQGLALAANGIYVGFFSNQVCFSLPFQPHAWPQRFRLTTEEDIIALKVSAGFILVLTKGNAYQITGSTPQNMDIAKIDTPYPCLSKDSVVNMGFGVMYATYAGLAVYNPATGLNLITRFIHDWDTWNDTVDPTTVVAQYYNGKYFASHSSGSFIFEQDDRIGGYFVNVDYRFTAAFTEQDTNKFYYTFGTQGQIYEWENDDAVLAPLEWKSKTITTKDYINLGAARVIADYTPTNQDTTNLINANEQVPVTNAGIWTNNLEIGTINGPTANANNSSVTELGTLNSAPIHEDNLTDYQVEIVDPIPVNFKLWVNKVLVFDQAITSDNIFRLPSGYRSDTFEVAVSGSARIRSIHLGETPFGLRAS